MSQREALMEQRAAALSVRQQQSQKDREWCMTQRAQVEALWMDMEERECRVLQVDKMLGQREKMLIKWWQAVEACERQVDIRSVKVEERETVLDAYEVQEDARRQDLEQREVCKGHGSPADGEGTVHRGSDLV